MNIYLIKASAPGPFKEYKKAMGAPPQNIFSVAAAIPEGVGIEMCDETIGMKPKMNTRADIVALFFHTPDAIHLSDNQSNTSEQRKEWFFKDYSGKFEGEKVTARVGYAVRQSYGYSIIGVVGNRDRRIKADKRCCQPFVDQLSVDNALNEP